MAFGSCFRAVSGSTNANQGHRNEIGEESMKPNQAVCEFLNSDLTTRNEKLKVLANQEQGQSIANALRFLMDHIDTASMASKKGRGKQDQKNKQAARVRKMIGLYVQPGSMYELDCLSHETRKDAITVAAKQRNVHALNQAKVEVLEFLNNNSEALHQLN